MYRGRYVMKRVQRPQHGRDLLYQGLAKYSANGEEGSAGLEGIWVLGKGDPLWPEDSWIALKLDPDCMMTVKGGGVHPDFLWHFFSR